MLIPSSSCCARVFGLIEQSRKLDLLHLFTPRRAVGKRHDLPRLLGLCKRHHENNRAKDSTPLRFEVPTFALLFQSSYRVRP